MGGYAKPFFNRLNRLLEWPTMHRAKRENPIRIEYLRQCKERGIDPYAHLDELEAGLKKRRKWWEGR